MSGTNETIGLLKVLYAIAGFYGLFAIYERKRRRLIG